MKPRRDGGVESHMSPSTTIESWYRLHAPALLRRCRTMLHDEAAARDAVHDVFVEVLRRQEHLNARDAGAYLWRAATHVCLNRLRATRRRPTNGAQELDVLPTSSDLASTANTVLDLQRCLQDEAPSTRTLAWLVFVEQHTLEEAAAAVGLSPSGVRKRLRDMKARAQLRRR